MTDEANKSRQSTSDALGRLVQVIEAPGTLNYLTNYTYDALGNLKQVLQSGQTRTFTYDSLSRLRTAANPESNTNTYTYDNNGNLLTKVDARSITTQTSYDGLNRPTLKTYTDGTPTVRYCYDGFDYDAVSGACTGSQVVGKKGRLTATGSAVSVTRFTAFDDAGRITASQQSTAGGDYNFIYGYNKAGGLEVQQYPSGRQVKSCYDAAGRVEGLTDLGDMSVYASELDYAPHGALSQLPLGNGIIESTLFNNRLQPFRIEAGDLLTLDFEYNTLGQTDNNGNVLKQKIDAPGLPAIRTQTYTYDGVNRLASITEAGGSTNWNRAYSYEAYGNRAATGANVFANTPQSLADFDPATNQLTAAWAEYDSAGNLTSFNKPAFEWTAAYDADNLQSSFTSGSTTTTYHYDGDGRRVKKLQGTRTTVFVYDAFGNLAAEYDTQPDPNLVAGTYYRTTDHLGSTRLVTDGNGAVVSRRDFFPFGEEIPANTTFGNRQQVTDSNPFTTYNQEFGVHQKYTGKESDGESGLDYFGARYLSPTTGRFTTVDPSRYSSNLANPQSWHRYAFVLGNPQLHVDPNGLWGKRVHSDLVYGAFPGLSASDRQIIIDANNRADAPVNQTFGRSFMHGMSDGLRGESSQAAEARANTFIETNRQAARAAFASTNQGIFPRGRVTFSQQALTHFGYLQHTVTDRFAPSHVGYQAWGPMDVIIHFFGSKHKRLDDNPSPRQFEIAKRLLQRAFLETFGPEAYIQATSDIDSREFLLRYLSKYNERSNELTGERIDSRCVECEP